MYPGDPGPPGGDCARVVAAVGAEVEGLKVGNMVFGVAAGSLEAYARGHHCHLIKMPAGMSFSTAASLPTLITTVQLALVELAGLHEGQQILVHAGAGGVGLTAIHYAQRLGCEVIATAGSREKQGYLRSLGVRMIASSRDAEAFRESMEEYRQVDVVLNSLSGGFIQHSLAALRAGGHICEIGKLGIWSKDEVSELLPDVTYSTIAIDALMAEAPGRFKGLLEAAMAFGVPQLPSTCFPIHSVVEAFEYLKEAKNIGKVVITQPPLVTEDGVYVISGGLGYLGRLVAAALIREGALRVVLLSSSRSDLPADWGLEVRPVVERCDVGNVEEVRSVMARYSNIRGIVHAAGVLADRTIAELAEEDFRKVYKPKVEGARHLHACSAGLDLDFFVMFSSIASGLGSAGQANYAAANGCLDALAMEREEAGLPGLSVRWGAWSGGGMATEETFRRVSKEGILPLSLSLGIKTLLQVLRHPPCAVVTVCPLDPKRLPATPYLSGVRVHESEVGSVEAAGAWVEGVRLLQKEERRGAIAAMIRAHVEAVSTVQDIDEKTSWIDAGLDLLSMVELENQLQQVLGDALQLSSSAMFDYPCLEELVDHIASGVLTEMNSVYEGGKPLSQSSKEAPARSTSRHSIERQRAGASSGNVDVGRTVSQTSAANTATPMAPEKAAPALAVRASKPAGAVPVAWSTQLEVTTNQITFGVESHVTQLEFVDEKTDGRIITVGDQKSINFGLCSYNALEFHTEIVEGVKKAMDQYGIQMAMPRYFKQTPLYSECEELFHQMTGAHCLIAQSTTLIHISVMPTMIMETDIVLVDWQAHSSIQTMSKILTSHGCPVYKIKHNSVANLEATLVANPGRKVWYLADGVYSMYGDVAPLKSLKDLMAKYPNLCLYIDDAHGFGCVGKHGSGYAMEILSPLTDRTIVVASLSKSFAAGGGIAMLASEKQKQLVLTLGGPLVFGCPLQIPVLGALIASARLHLSSEIVEIQSNLQRRVEYCTELVVTAGLPLVSRAPIPIRFIGCGPIEVAVDLGKRMLADGFLVDVTGFPAVPMRKSGILFTLTNHHTMEDIEGLVACLKTRKHMHGVLHSHGMSMSEVCHLFGIDGANMADKSAVVKSPAAPTVRLSEFSSVQHIDKQEWNALFGRFGSMDHTSLRVLEENQLGTGPGDSWQFPYFFVRNDNGEVVCATFFTDCMWKEDMLASKEVSEMCELQREQEPLYNTESVFLNGSMLCLGEPIYINEAQDWRQGLSLILSVLQQRMTSVHASSMMFQALQRR